MPRPRAGGGPFGRKNFFSFCSPREMAGLAKIAKRAHYGPHKTIHRAGAPSRRLILPEAGVCEQVAAGASGNAILGLVSPGTCFGIESILSPSHRYSNALVSGGGGCDVFELELYKLFAFVKKESDLWERLLYAAARALGAQAEVHTQRLSLLYAALSSLQNSSGNTPALESALSKIMEGIGADCGLIASFDQTVDRITVEASRGFRPSLTDASFALRSDTLLSLVYNTRQPLLLTKSAHERKYLSAPYYRVNFLAVPVFDTGTPIGALALGRSDSAAYFTDADRCLLALTAALIGAYMSASRQKQMAEQFEFIKRTYVISLPRS